MTASTASSIGFSALIVVVVFLSMDVLVAHAAAGRPDFVAKACNRATAMSSTKKIRFTERFCESTLRSDSQSSLVKDYIGLVLVSMDRLKVRIDATAAKIRATNITVSMGERAERELQFCGLDYSDMAGFLPVCRDMVQGRWNTTGCVERIREASDDCNVSLELAYVGEVLSKEKDELMVLISLTNTLLEILDSTY